MGDESNWYDVDTSNNEYIDNPFIGVDDGGVAGGGDSPYPDVQFDWPSVLTGGKWDLAKLAAKGLTLAGAIDAYNRAKNPPQTGYQGGIPSLTAVRAQTAPQAVATRPGAGGHRYFSDTMYANNKTPADTVSGLEAIKALVANQATDLNTANQWRASQQAAAQPAAQTPAQLQAAQDKFYGRTPQGLAAGGMPRYLQGGTDGMADKIPATIDGEQPAALAHGEFVVPADVVSHLGNGNSDAGADVLYKMMDRIRKARTGTKAQGKKIDPNKFTPGGLAYAAGGSVLKFAGETGSTVPAPSTGMVGTESNLSNWVGPYVTDMLAKGQALSTMPYQAYQGPLTAGDSALQQQAYGLAGGLQTPASIGQAATTAGQVASNAGGLSYQPTGATNQFTAPGQYTAAQNTSAFNQPGQYTAAQNANTFTAPTNTGYTAAPDITAQKFTDPGVASSYMNPYLRQSLDPQLQEARRQSQITQQANNAQATQAGAFGGARQGILAAENQRNLGANLANITGQGYNTAYTTGQNQFNADQGRSLAAQQANQAAANQAAQFGAQQGMTAAQLQAQYGLSAQQANEMSRQFGANYGMQGAQTAAQYGLAAQQANEASRQFGAQYGMQGAQNTAQYGQQAQAQNAQENQFAANYGLQGLNAQLQAAQAQGQLGALQNQTGIANLNTLAGLGATQQATQQAGITADQAAFNAERDNPYKMVQYQQSLLQGLPLAAQSYNISTNPYYAAAGAAADVGKTLGVTP